MIHKVDIKSKRERGISKYTKSAMMVDLIESFLKCKLEKFIIIMLFGQMTVCLKKKKGKHLTFAPPWIKHIIQKTLPGSL